MTNYINVLVLSNQGGEGVLYDGGLGVQTRKDESLASAALRRLRAKGVETQDGDWLFFPDAWKGYRIFEVKGERAERVQAWKGGV